MINQIMLIAGFVVIMLLLTFGFSIGIIQVRETIKDMKVYGFSCCIAGVLYGSATCSVCVILMALLLTNVAS